MKQRLLTLIAALVVWPAAAQLIYDKDKIVSAYAIKDDKAARRKQRLIDQANSLATLSIDSAIADIESALWAVSQFLVRTPQSDAGISRLMQQFSKLPGSVQRGLLEVIYGLYPTEYTAQVRQVLEQTNQPKQFAQAAVYLLRQQPAQAPFIRSRLQRQFPAWRSNDLLTALADYIDQFGKPQPPLPPLDSLFAHQRLHGFKVVYSFQRRNRLYPGLAVVQQADGRFARDSSGRLQTFVQLARSASHLPYFLTNGSTPQGLYAITGTAVSKNVFIGPTPNLQMVMMHEVNPPQFTHYQPLVFNAPPEKIYRSYFPPSWQQWPGLLEAYRAGKIGRSEIIAHGSTIDPEWFKGQPYYPLSPTLGCLSGREWWDPATGRLQQSDQLDLVNCFIATPGTRGYLIVIDLDDENRPVTPADIAPLVDKWEQQQQ
jgi:hypothetical protein